MMGTLLQIFAIFMIQVLILVEAANITTPISLVGNTLILTPTQNTFWVSSANTFAFGFLATPSSSSSSSPSFTLSLFYSELSQFQITRVWSPHRGHLLTQDASLHLTAQGGLTLFDSPGAQVIWSTNTSQNGGIASLSISDEGNIVLYGSDSNTIWQSWDEPITDTLLPGQSLYSGAGVVDNTGRYKLRMQTDSNFVLYFLGSLSKQQNYWSNYYWSAGTWGLNVTQVYYNVSQGLVLLNNITGHVVMVLLQSSSSSQLERMVLLESGTLTRYRLSSDGKTWSPVTQVPSSVCYVLGLCGQYGICNSNPNDITNYTCTCPNNEFDYNDARDPSMGCRTNYPLDCDQGSKLTRLAGLQYSVTLNSTNSSPNWAYQYDYALSTEDECAQLCNASCECAAATYDGATCHFNSVGQVFSGNKERSTSVTYLKTAVHPENGNNVEGREEKQVISTGAVVGISVTLGLAFIVGCANLAWWYHRTRSTEAHMIEDEDELSLLEGGLGPVHFSYKELKAASNGFTNLLGRGGFGPVYKGVLAGGAIVAIKKLEGSVFGEKQFRAEVVTIGSVHHMNLVRLRGYCTKGSQKMLVYEFMPKGSLDRYIFHDDSVQQQNQVLLNWETRFQILLSTARAIRYLHEECQPFIVHCDIKPENILLDEAFNAKVSDFGMAQLVGGEAGLTDSITRIRGTIGYMAPEWMSSKHITTKADVYSFGMVVLEVISGRRSIDTNVNSVSKVELSTWVYSQVMEHHVALTILDPRLQMESTSNGMPFPAAPEHATSNMSDTSEDYDQHILSDMSACPATSDLAHVAPEFYRAVHVALWCIHKDPSIRPSMGLVVQMLEGIVPAETPPYPF